jgi:HAD superfamily hydrolase (TIGR01509 family)
MESLAALIFDVDGTLSETEELHRQAFNDAFAILGLDWHWDRTLYGELLKVTGGKERILHYLERHHPDELAALRPLVPEIHARKTARYTSLIDAGAIGLRPGVARLITEARRAGLRLAIATTTSRPNVITLLRSAFPISREAIFEVIVAGDEVARKKPWPDVYEAALTGLHLPATACIALEDSRNGVLAAHRAGLPVVVTPSLYTASDVFGDALSVVSDLGEPRAPYRHVSGHGKGEGCVTIDALRRWCVLDVSLPATRSLVVC